MIENTSDRDPLLHLIGSMSPGYVEDMEAAGQRQIVHSDRVPTEGSEALVELGFTLGDQDPHDDLFRAASMPAGWKREGSDHAMWSYILDDLGRRRVSIFYKAAFYDRRAFCRAETVRSYADALMHSRQRPVFDDTWCTRSTLRNALGEIRGQRAERVELYERSTVEWAAEELPKCRAQLAEVDAYVARYLDGAA